MIWAPQSPKTLYSTTFLHLRSDLQVHSHSCKTKWNHGERTDYLQDFATPRALLRIQITKSIRVHGLFIFVVYRATYIYIYTTANIHNDIRIDTLFKYQ